MNCWVFYDYGELELDLTWGALRSSGTGSVRVQVRGSYGFRYGFVSVVRYGFVRGMYGVCTGSGPWFVRVRVRARVGSSSGPHRGRRTPHRKSAATDVRPACGLVPQRATADARPTHGRRTDRRTAGAMTDVRYDTARHRTGTAHGLTSDLPSGPGLPDCGCAIERLFGFK
jgi:hypothetical protein